MHVKPAQGYSIRDPDLLDLLPVNGRDVPESDYWHRRLRDKDVELVDPSVKAEPDEPQPTAELAGSVEGNAAE